MKATGVIIDTQSQSPKVRITMIGYQDNKRVEVYYDLSRDIINDKMGAV